MLFNDKSVAVEVAIESLKAWAISGPPLPAEGICVNLDIAIYCKDIDWPEHSGVHGYPVPAVGENTIAAYFADEDVWSGPYGESRKRLCIHLAEKFEKDGLPLRCLKLHTMGFFERLKWGIMKKLFNY